MIEFMIDPDGFVPESHPAVCLLETDVAEPEIMVREIGTVTEQSHPALFTGESPQVFYRLRYTPPYDNFHEIRSLILRTRMAAGLCSSYRGIVAIDVSEYRGHEEDEYFTIFLKYLYDCSDFQNLIFVCCQYSERDMQRLRSACMKYFPVRQERFRFFEKPTLKRIIGNTFREAEIKAGDDASELLADILCREEFVPWRSLQLLERLPREIRADNRQNQKRNQPLHAAEIRSFLQDPECSLCMMAGHVLLQTQKEDADEKTL